MDVDWGPLRRMLGTLRGENHRLAIWWRDDDAVAPSAPLDHLCALSNQLNIPVHIAVIPASATPDLAAFTHDHANLTPLVHGWRHQNNAPLELKKSEFGTLRPDGCDELRQGQTRMRALFGRSYLPVFVPPWNRLDHSFLPALTDAGYLGVSTFTPRDRRDAAPGLLQINTHVDPISWRGDRGLKDADALIAQTVDLLRARLNGTQDPTEPLGYLTHHLVHTPQVWDFSERYLTELLEGGAEAQPIAPLLETPR